MRDQHPLLEVSRLSVKYGSRAALSEVSFSLDCGEILSVIGPNGAGKSTLVRAISGRTPPNSGAVRVQGHDIAQSRSRALLGIAPQNPALYGKLTAYENLVCSARQAGLTSREGRANAEQTLELVGAQRISDIRAERMSGGMRARINIAAAIVHRPSLVILDEPAASLDPDSSQAINELVCLLAAEGFAVVVVTHDMKQAEDVSSRVLFLKDGSVLAYDTPVALRQNALPTQTEITIKLKAGEEPEPLRLTGFYRGDMPGSWHAELSDTDSLLERLTFLEQNDIDVEWVTARRPDFSRVYEKILHGHFSGQNQ
jgi:ABC-2 type transport system ATP-binding protein